VRTAESVEQIEMRLERSELAMRTLLSHKLSPEGSPKRSDRRFHARSSVRSSDVMFTSGFSSGDEQTASAGDYETFRIPPLMSKKTIRIRDEGVWRRRRGDDTKRELCATLLRVRRHIVVTPTDACDVVLCVAFRRNNNNTNNN